MKIAGIIAEYNPFHNGHAYHIEHTRAEKEGDASHVIAVMSGYFTQRGEPALVDPHIRAEAALKSGVDLVISLPVPWALSSAQGFAEAGVFLLDALGCVDMLSFGSECGDIEALTATRKIMDDPRVVQRMRGLMETGLSYAEAMRKAVCEAGGENRAKLLDTPNNTLGLEYMGALSRAGSAIEPFTVRRMGAEHDALAPIGGTASASYLREMIRSGRPQNIASFVPNDVCNLIIDAVRNGTCPSREALAERAVMAVLRLRTKEQLASLPALSEGIENRLYNAIRESGTLEDIIENAKTKRYVRTRIQRLVYCAFLGVTEEVASRKPPYIRVLGATEAGIKILSAAKERGTTVPVISQARQVPALLDAYGQHVYDLECRAADLFALTLDKPYPCGKEMTEGMIKV